MRLSQSPATTSQPLLPWKSTHTWSLGTRFDIESRYSILDSVGQGAYGIVCAARDDVADTVVAIKKMEMLMGEKHKSDTLLEGRAAAYTVDMEKKLIGVMANFREEIKNKDLERNRKFSKMEADFTQLIEKFDGEYQVKMLR